jgi:hypothetical protein
MKTFTEFLKEKGEVIEEGKKKKNWIGAAVKHPGRCTPGSENYDCPKGSPQWRLAQRFKKGDIHKDNLKKDEKKKD